MEFNGTFLATIITFIVFVILMNKVLYVPILSIIEERKSFIEGNYKASQENDSKVAELTLEKDGKLSNAKEEAKKIYNDFIDDYKSKRADLISSSEENAKNKIKQTEQDFEKVSNDVKCALRSSMSDLASDVVEKIVGYRSEVKDIDEELVNRVLWDK